MHPFGPPHKEGPHDDGSGPGVTLRSTAFSQTQRFFGLTQPEDLLQTVVHDASLRTQ
jgi:hypothetical protein